MTMRVRAHLGGLDDLQRDVRQLGPKSISDSRALIRRAGTVGNTVARDNARRSSGAHGKHYPRSFTAESSSFIGFGGASFQAVYGPVAGRPQGDMSFEFGSRNQPPHLDLARSADLMGPVLAQEVRQMAGSWFW